jgi:dienelactone hydrolase
LLLVVAVCLSGCLSPRGNEAADLLADIAAGDGPSRLKQTATEPLREPIRYRRAAGDAVADLYRNTERPRGAVVVVPGLTPHGKDDPRLVSFAKSLARAQLFVLVPDIANTRALKVSAGDSAEIAAAIEELAARFAGGAERSVGLVAISYAVGPALLAAAETPAGRNLRFIVAIGGYYDIAAAIGFVTTGAYQETDGSWRRGAPNEFGKLVFLRSNADRIDDPSDRARLIAIAERRLADPAADIGPIVARLGLQARTVYELIDNREPQQVAGLIARLPDPILRELRTLDLRTIDLSRVPGPVFLVHGADDPIIPAGESAKLAATLGLRAELTLVERFAHVDAATTSLADSIRLLRATTRILEERDREVSPLR